MQGMAIGLMGSEREEDGFRLYGASCARLVELHTTMLDEVAFWVKFRERYLPPARERIGPAAAIEAEQEGCAMGWQKALAYAFAAAAEDIVALCRRGRFRQALPILSLPLPKRLPRGVEWIEAYRRWIGGR